MAEPATLSTTANSRQERRPLVPSLLIDSTPSVFLPNFEADDNSHFPAGVQHDESLLPKIRSLLSLFLWTQVQISRSICKQVLACFTPPTSPNQLQGARDLSDEVFLSNTRPIERGGFCDLYEGYYQRTKVVLRRPRYGFNDPDIMRRFKREILLSQISHPNILPTLGQCTIGSDLYMVSPYIQQGDLLRCIQRNRTIDKLEILRQVASAISDLHPNDIIHGDIKAKNILMSEQNTALLCDFGLAKGPGSVTTSAGVKGMGSTRWMAPELFENAPKSKESDVYAFGMLIAEVMTGQPPLPDVQDHAVAAHVLYMGVRPQRPKGCQQGADKVAWDIAELCWAKEPCERPQIATVLDMLSFNSLPRPPG